VSSLGILGQKHFLTEGLWYYWRILVSPAGLEPATR
jgi:hypothetical protein